MRTRIALHTLSHAFVGVQSETADKARSQGGSDARSCALCASVNIVVYLTQGGGGGGVRLVPHILEARFSAISNSIVAAKDSFCGIFRDLND